MSLTMRIARNKSHSSPKQDKRNLSDFLSMSKDRKLKRKPCNKKYNSHHLLHHISYLLLPMVKKCPLNHLTISPYQLCLLNVHNLQWNTAFNMRSRLFPPTKLREYNARAPVPWRNNPHQSDPVSKRLFTDKRRHQSAHQSLRNHPWKKFHHARANLLAHPVRELNL